MKRIAALMFSLIMLLSCSAMAEQEGTGHSRLTPAGVGQPVSCTFVQDKVEFDVTLALQSTKRGNSAEAYMNMFSDFDFGSKFKMYPEDDFSLSIFEVTCACDDPNAPLEMNYYDFNAFSIDGQLFEYVFVMPNRYTNPTIYSGGTCEFHLAIPVPADKRVGIVFDGRLWFYDDTQME